MTDNNNIMVHQKSFNNLTENVEQANQYPLRDVPIRTARQSKLQNQFANASILAVVFFTFVNLWVARILSKDLIVVETLLDNLNTEANSQKSTYGINLSENNADSFNLVRNEGNRNLDHEHDGVNGDGGDVQVGTTPLNTGISSQPSSPYAYVWVVGGIHEDKPSYKGFIWDVLISASLLRKTGSTADFWIYTRLSPESKHDSIFEEDKRVLEALGIRIKELEKPEHESFGQLVYDKFLTINMTDYKRVMFLDADTVPLTNLDYLFHLSDPDNVSMPTILKPNFIYASRMEPCNTGAFIVQPSAEIFKQYKEVVRAQHEKGKSLPYPHFSRNDGWGYSFRDNNDYWESIMNKRPGKRWNFYAAHSDQGLMYYVMKFLYKEVSINIGPRLQNWKAVEGQFKPELESESIDILKDYQPELLGYMYECDNKPNQKKSGTSTEMEFMCRPPYNSFAHFYGGMKPWSNKYQMKWINRPFPRKSFDLKVPKKIWFRELSELNQKLNMGIDLEHWNEKYGEKMKASPLGLIALRSDQHNIIEDE